jgi:hypothetical protein
VESEYVGYTHDWSGSVMFTACGVPAIKDREYVYVGQDIELLARLYI